MSWLLLGLAVLSALLTINVFRPVRAPFSLAVASFFAGWLTGELAIHHLVVQLVVFVVLVWAGGLEDWPGIVGALILAGSWAGLLLAWRSSHRSRQVFESALASLGRSRGRVRYRPTGRQRVLPFWTAHPEVDRIGSLPFAEVGGVTLRADVYRPHRGEPPGPVLIYIHGGGFVLGYRDKQGLPLLYHLASVGWVCFSIDYRLSPRATFPEQLVDVKRGIAWVREIAPEYGGDPSFLALCGNSAGAHLAALAALTADVADYQPGFAEANTSADACVTLYGHYDLTDGFGHWPHRAYERILERHVIKVSRQADPHRYRRASPLHWVSGSVPPFLVIHGDRDSLVPVDEARRFVEALRETEEGVCLYAEVPGAQHAFDLFACPRTTAAINAIDRFLEWARADRAVAGRVGDARPDDG